MFTPSLVSMLLHSIWSDLDADRPLLQSGTTQSVAHDLQDLLRRHGETRLPMPWVPVIGRTRDYSGLDDLRQMLQVTEDRHLPGNLFVYGRVPVDRLVRRYLQGHALDNRTEYLDLGTPLAAAQNNPGLRADIGRLLALPTAPSRLVQVALVDRGDAIAGAAASSFGGRVVQVVPSGVDWSGHALQVFGTLLDRLAANGHLGQADFLCALVTPPPAPVGRGCFDSANAVELQQALRDLAMAADGRPMVVNVSMGTHVGPHNGLSPLEQTTASQLPYHDQRVLVFAAGNDGMAGVSARRELQTRRQDFLRFRTGSAGMKDLLLEFWWDEPQASTLTLTIDIRRAGGQPACLPITITPANSGVNMTQRGGFRSIACLSLYHARCSATMSCTAFAMSTATAADLADLTIDITLECDNNAVVNAWKLLPANDGSSFITGSVEGSILVPATAAGVVSVAGVERGGQSWIESARGPSADYVPGGLSGPTAPSMAHLVHFRGGERGTSYASPRASADITAEVLANLAAGTGLPPTLLDLVQDTLMRRSALGAWDPRVGYGAITV